MDTISILHQKLQFVAILKEMLVFLKKLSKSFVSYLESNPIDHVIVVPEGNDDEIHQSSHTTDVIRVDFLDYDRLLSTVKNLQPHAIVTDYEHYIKTASRLSADLGLSALSVESAERCTDKNVMRKAFHAYDPAITPDFMRVLNEDDLERFAADHDFPIMLKPTNLMKSLFITRNDDIDQLRANYRQMIKDMPAILESLQALQEPEIIVEEFLGGTMHTVAGFAGPDGTPRLIPDIVDIETGRDRGSDENFLYSRMLPSTLNEDVQSQVLEVAEKGMRALDMRSTAAHIEIIVAKDGPKLIEIGARPGGYRPRMYSEALGIDFYGAFLAAVQDSPIDLRKSKNGSTCTVEVFPEQRGMIKEFSNKQELEQLKSLHYVSYRITEGNEAGLPSQGFKSALIVTLVNDEHKQLLDDKKFIDEHVRVIT